MELTNFFNAIAAGIIQGVTELFPVSSSGHLLLFSHITKMDIKIAEIAVLHLGTFIAIVIGMWDKIKEIRKPNTLINIIIASIPGGIIGFLSEDWISEKLSANWIIAASLIFWGLVLIVIDQTTKNKKFKTNKISQVSPRQAALVGLGQVFAFIPGTSRSGVTTVSGILSGIQPQTSLEFGFLAGVILIPGSGALSIIKGLDTQISPQYIILATVISAITGIIAIKTLRKYLNKRILTYCGIYRILLGTLIFLFV